MAEWLIKSGAATNCEMSKPRVRVFNDIVARHFHAMQRSQRCLEVELPQGVFPRHRTGTVGRFFMCRVADNMNPRIWTQNRELVLRQIRPWLFGVDPEVHGGPWLSQALVDTFVYGLKDKEVPVASYICPKALEGKCPGRKTLCLQKEKPPCEGGEK